MADFKIVISDPQAPKEETVVKVKVVGDPEIKFDENVKEGFELPILKMNSKTAEKIKAVHGVATIRMYKPGTKDKVKITGKIIVDDNIPENEVRVNAEQLVNATGTNELEGELFRARAWQIRINDDRTKLLIGLKIGDEFDGSIVGLKNVKLKIRGGSDNSGFSYETRCDGWREEESVIIWSSRLPSEREGRT